MQAASCTSLHGSHAGYLEPEQEFKRVARRHFGAMPATAMVRHESTTMTCTDMAAPAVAGAERPRKDSRNNKVEPHRI